MKKAIEYIKNPKFILLGLDRKGIFRLSDKKFLELTYLDRMGKRLNLKDPKTFNEKLQWLKLYDRKPEYTAMVDKYEVKKYVADIIGDEYIIPTLGIYDKWEGIDFNKLPNQFVMKCTHDSGGIVICKDKSKFDLKSAEKKIKKSLKRNYFYCGREWPYKNIKPRIIVEKYISDNFGMLNDYKIQCINGKVDNILVCLNRFCNSGVRYNYYDKNFNYLDYSKIPDRSERLDKPKNFDKMILIAKKLSDGLNEIRVDLYNVDGKIYFGELTFYTNSGFDTTITEEADKIIGSHLILEVKNEN